LSLFAFAVSCASFAQNVGPQTMDLAMQTLRESTGVAMILRGEDRAGTRLVPLAVNTYFIPATATAPPKLELWSYRNNALDRLIVADGENITRYDPVLNQYSITPYRSGAELMMVLPTLAGGAMTNSVRLLRDMGRTEAWQPWLRSTSVVGATASEFSLEAGDPVYQRYTYRFVSPLNLEKPVLKEISSIEDRGGLRSSWTMQVILSFTAEEVKFKFVAPPGAKPVSSPSSVRSPQ